MGTPHSRSLRPRECLSFSTRGGMTPLVPGANGTLTSFRLSRWILWSQRTRISITMPWNAPRAQMVLERPVGDFKLGDVELIGLAEKHQCHSEGDQHWDSIATEFGISLCPPNNVIAFDNTIQILETGGLRIAVWGDNRPSPAPDLDKYLQHVDVLILPIDGSQHILTYAEVDQVIQRYSPKAIIPAHYLTEGAESVLSGLKSADFWVESQKNVRRIDRDEVIFNRAELEGASHRVYYFGNHYAKE